jgi:IS30 family transposase
VYYRPEQRLAAVTSPRAKYVQGEPVDLARVERVIHSRYLSLFERERLYDLHRAGLSMRAIAVELGRAPSTISRELARNTTSTHGYLPHGAHRASVQRRRRPKQHKLFEGSTLRRYVEARLRGKWSPQQISHRLIKDFPGDLEMRVSTETKSAECRLVRRRRVTRPGRRQSHIPLKGLANDADDQETELNIPVC